MSNFNRVGVDVPAGTIFNSWTVLKEVPKDERPYRRERFFVCRCICGNEAKITYKSLKYNKSKACTKCRQRRSMETSKKKWNPIEAPSYYLIPLTMNKFAKIDKEDLSKIIEHAWCYNMGYAFTRICGKVIGMHYLINETPEGFCTHHINGDKLDNRKNNLTAHSRKEHVNIHRETLTEAKLDRKRV